MYAQVLFHGPSIDGKSGTDGVDLHKDIDHTICFQFRGQHSIIKTCMFYYSESDVFNVNFDKDVTTHQISARTRCCLIFCLISEERTK